METIVKFFDALNKAWDKEPETLIELGITDEVFINIQNFVMQEDKIMYTFLEQVSITIKDLENSGFGCGMLTTEERVSIHNILNKSK